MQQETIPTKEWGSTEKQQNIRVDVIQNTNRTTFLIIRRRSKERLFQQKSLIEEAREVLVKKMDSDKVIHHMRVRNIISRKEEYELLQITSKAKRAKTFESEREKS